MLRSITPVFGPLEVAVERNDVADHDAAHVVASSQGGADNTWSTSSDPNLDEDSSMEARTRAAVSAGSARWDDRDVKAE
jgi:hypothetical protein